MICKSGGQLFLFPYFPGEINDDVKQVPLVIGFLHSLNTPSLSLKKNDIVLDNLVNYESMKQHLQLTASSKNPDKCVLNTQKLPYPLQVEMKNQSTRRTPFTNLLNAYLYLYSLPVRLSNSLVVCSVRTFWFLTTFPSGIYSV